MSWLYSRALVAAFSEANALDGKRSVQLKTTPMLPDAFYCAKTRGISRLSRYGMMLEPLANVIPTQDNKSKTWLNSVINWLSQAGSHVKGYLGLEKGKDYKIRAQVYGLSFTGLFAKYDRLSSSWKTPIPLIFEDLTESLPTWPKSGTMRNGAVWAREKREHTTFENAPGSWPTPTVMMTGITGTTDRFKARQKRAKDRHGNKQGRTGPDLAMALKLSGEVGLLNPNWEEWLMGWPIGWTALEPLETAKFQEWQQQHSSCFIIA